MNITTKSDKKLLSELYHDIEEATKLIEKYQPKVKVPEQASWLNQIEIKLDQAKSKIVATFVSEIINQQTAVEIETIDEFTLKKALELIEKIELQAKMKKLKVVIAVFNSSAHPIAVHCMDDSYIASYDIAVNKAFTSVALKMSTSALKSLSQPGKELYGIQHTNQGRIVIFGGGEPLFYKNKLVGAIGVSGGSESDDTELAEYGTDIIEEVMKW